MRYETWENSFLIAIGGVALVFSREPDSDGRRTLSVTAIFGR
jgi:hypothetical protein